MTVIRLPWPPSVNHYYERNRNGGIRIGKKGKLYRNAVTYKVRQLNIEKMGGWIKAIIELFPPDNRRRDIDNVKKCLFDALTIAGAWYDDSQIRVDHTVFYGRFLNTDGCIVVDIENVGIPKALNL